MFLGKNKKLKGFIKYVFSAWKRSEDICNVILIPGILEVTELCFHLTHVSLEDILNELAEIWLALFHWVLEYLEGFTF